MGLTHPQVEMCKKSQVGKLMQMANLFYMFSYGILK